MSDKEDGSVRTLDVISLERETLKAAASKARGVPPATWVVWAFPTTCLCAVILFVNIENANVAKRVANAWSTNQRTGELDEGARDRARYALLAVTLAAVAIHVVLSVYFFRYMTSTFAAVDSAMRLFARFFDAIIRNRLQEAEIAFRDPTEVEKITESHEFLGITFSRYKQIAAAQHEMGLANLWLREYNKFLPDGTAIDGAGDDEADQCTKGTKAETRLAAPIRALGSPLHHEQTLGLTSIANSPLSAESRKLEASVSPTGHTREKDDNVQLPCADASNTDRTVVSKATLPKPLRRRTATIVMAYYPESLMFKDAETGPASATAFVEISLKCCRETKGWVLTNQPDRFVMCWNAFSRQPDHEKLGLECATRLGAALEERFQEIHGQCSCSVVGVTGHVVAGLVKTNKSRHRVVFGDCVTVINEVGDLLCMHQLLEGVPGSRAWMAPEAAARMWPLPHHVPYDCVTIGEGGKYILYRILDTTTDVLDSGTSAVSDKLQEAFRAFYCSRYDVALKTLQKVGDSEHYSTMDIHRFMGLSGNAKTLFSVWERLKMLSESYCGTGLRYTHNLPHWAQFTSDVASPTPLSSSLRDEPNGNTGTEPLHHHWRDRRPTLEAQLLQQRGAPSPSATHDGNAPASIAAQTNLEMLRSTRALGAPHSETAVVADSTSPDNVTNGARGNHTLSNRQPDVVASNSNRDFWDSSKMHFRLTNKELGVTPTSKVVLGLSIGNGSLVAVKIVKFAPMNLSAMSRRRRVRDGYLVTSSLDTILAEVKTMSALRSSKIVGYVTAAVFDERHELFLVMEYVSGGSLHHIARSHQDSRLPLWLARRYLREVLESLKYLHTKGVLHCDIKPQNVLVPDVGPCKLSDFGISRTISEVSPSKWPNNGTPMYMAPEAFKGDLTQKSDVYSFGVMLGEVVTGRPPSHQLSSVAPKECAVPEELENVGNNEAKAVFIACTQIEPENRPTVEQLLSMPFFTERITSS